MENFETTIEKIMSGEKALSYSSLRQFLESPRHFKKHVTEPEITDAMIDGQRFHMAVLEPEKFIEKHWFLDDSEKVKEIGGGSPRATKLYKEWKAEQIEKNEGKEMISLDDFNAYMSMKEALYRNRSTKPLMESLTEREKFVQIEYEGFLINMKIDGMSDNTMIDLKKVADAKLKRIKWDIRDKHYDMQAGLYEYATGRHKYYIPFIDKGCNITLIKLTPGTLSEGFGKFQMAIDKFVECAEQDLWDSSYEFWNGGYINI
jgi:hypothetical protein